MVSPRNDGSGHHDAGEPQAAGGLPDLTHAYDRLRRLAYRLMRNERPDHTLQPTALVHEAALRIGRDAADRGEAYLFGAAAQAMRRILV